jgi:hypothetical protein
MSWGGSSKRKLQMCGILISVLQFRMNEMPFFFKYVKLNNMLNSLR